MLQTTPSPNTHINHLQSCIEIVNNLDPDAYPHLTLYFRRTRGKAILLMILSHFLAYESPAYIDQSGKAWYTVSMDYLISKYGGSKETWQSHIVYLTAIELIHRIKPSKGTKVQVMRSSYQKAVSQGRAAESWYSIPNYIPKRLREAENGIAYFKAKGISPSHLNKAGMIAACGQRFANKLYVDRRRVSPLQDIVENAIISRTRYAIREHGYISKEILFKRVMNHVQRNVLQYGYGKYEYVQRKLNNVWANMRNHLLAIVGAEYRRPTKEEIELYHLPNAKWLIIKKNDSEPVTFSI